MALACSPALCAKADAPTNGWWCSGAMWASSAIAWLTRCSSGRHSAGTTGRPILVTRLPIRAKVSALPARSPYPFAVPCTWVTPDSTAARELATAPAVAALAGKAEPAAHPRPDVGDDPAQPHREHPAVRVTHD